MISHLGSVIQSVKWTKKDFGLKEKPNTEAWVKEIFESPKVILSHNTAEDPILILETERL